MRTRIRRRPVLLIAAALLSAALAGTLPAPALAKYAALVVDAATGEVLYEANADKRNYPASLTKMMTLYLVFEALERKELELHTPMHVSSTAAAQPPTKLGLAAGQTIAVKDAIQAIAVKSANDMAVVVAEHLGGSESAFAHAMTRKARQLGMHRTVFRNASGLPNPKQVSTARDMATLARALMDNYPQYYHFFSKPSFRYAGHFHHNHNRLLGEYAGLDGIKTGYIRASGFNLVASAERGGRRLIGVVFGGQTAASRNQHMRALLDQGFGEAKSTVLTRHWSEGAWGIQVGTFSEKGPAIKTARSASRHVQGIAPNALVRVEETRRKGGKKRYSALLLNTGRDEAEQACHLLAKKKFRCQVVQRGGAATVTAGKAGDETLETPVPKPLTATTLAVDPAGEGWAVQVGSFRHHKSAYDAVRQATKAVPTHLAEGEAKVVRRTTGREADYYLAQIQGLSREKAAAACQQLSSANTACLVVAAAPRPGAPALAKAIDPDQAEGSTPTGNPPGPSAEWAVQVGVVAAEAAARALAEKAVKAVPDALEDGDISVSRMTLKKGGTRFQARIVGITERQAEQACRDLRAKKRDCMIVRM
jgi:D-alanyl-D-alanine carboxypeptidase